MTVYEDTSQQRAGGEVNIADIIPYANTKQVFNHSLALVTTWLTQNNDIA